MRKFASYFLVAIIGGLILTGIYKTFENKNSSIVATVPQENLNTHQANYTPRMAVVGPDFVVAADLSIHAVVHIKAELQQRNEVYDDYFDFFNEFFGKPYQRHGAPLIATGSGVIITSDGYIVTNNHVVQNSSKLEITLNDKRSYEAKIIGTDPTTDLALIKIDADNLPFLHYGNSDRLMVGEWVLAVGNPFNLTSTVTAGIVSAKARNINILGEVSAIESFIQTDAVVNRGNSGGALVNTDGELIGINAAIASNTGSYTGYSFAIPVNIVKKIVNDLKDFGEIQRAYLGVTFREIDSRFADEKGLKEINGVYVINVLEDGAAFDAGMEAGDIIIKVENMDINSKSTLLESVGIHRPGDQLKVIAYRDNELMEFNVVLKNRSGNTDIVKNDNIELLGATFKPISDEIKSELNIEHGLQVVDLKDGKIKSSGIREGFIIIYIDKNAVKSVNEMKYIIDGKKGGTLIEGIYPNGLRAYYGLGL